MAKTAVAIAQAVSHPIAQVSPPLRDFSQPWLDLNDKSVLVTGGTGSFGKQFLKLALERYRPRRLVVFSLVLATQSCPIHVGFGDHCVGTREACIERERLPE